MRNFLIFFLAASFLTPLVSGQAVGQAAQFEAVKEAYESGEYRQTIDLLAGYELSFGTSPRLESLRAMAYRDLNMPHEAYKALMVYFKLTANKDLSGNDTHRELIELRDRLSTDFDKEREEKIKKLEEERSRDADNIVRQLAATFDDKRKALPSGNASTAEADMWARVRESKNPDDYYLFLKAFPKGQFAEAAVSRLGDLDPIWQEVKKSSDPYEYSDYILNYPDSPLIDKAYERMGELTKIQAEWKRIENTRDPSVLRVFIKRSAGTSYAEKAAKALESLEVSRWEQVRFGKLSDFQAFLKEFPDGNHATDARALIAAITGRVEPSKKASGDAPKSEGTSLSFIWVSHGGHSGYFGRGYGKLTFDGMVLKYTEIEKEKYKRPDPEHNFTYSCSELEGFKGKNWLYLMPKGKERIIFWADENLERVKEFVGRLVTACNLLAK